MSSQKRKAIIIDLDGTLCDVSHRRHHVEASPKNWDAFYAGIAEDTPNQWCLDLVYKYLKFPDTTVIFVSGRPEKYRRETLAWLDRYFVVPEPFFQRKDGDFRQDAIVKTEIYKTQIEPYYDVIFCIDDRQQVVDAWRALGLVCLQCAAGDF